MSNPSNFNQSEAVVLHNIYFDGKVQSLALETDKGRATVGVMKKGVYQFSTSSPEQMVVVSGSMNVKLYQGSWKEYMEQDQFDVAANTTFDVVCDTDVAYLCYYG